MYVSHRSIYVPIFFSSQKDPQEFRRMLRMPPHIFDQIVNGVRPLIERRDTNFRQAISVEEKVTLTLYYLATGAKISTLQYAFLIGLTSVRRAIHETTRAIHKVLGKQYLKTPKKTEDWKEVAKGFRQRWQYPCCIGALDGKHVEIGKPPSSGSHYYNYKEYFSVVMMVLANWNYEILYLVVGSEGRLSDGGIYKDSDLFKGIENGTLNLPEDEMLLGHRVRHHIVGDDAFALSPRLMKPYSRKVLTDADEIFNYRLSRARRIVENVFGILSSRFQVLQGAIKGTVQSTNHIVLACATIHNLLRRECGRSYLPQGTVDYEDTNGDVQAGEWRDGNRLDPLQKCQARNHPVTAKEQRDAICNYFLSDEGSVPWQFDRFKRMLAKELEKGN